MIIKDNYNGYLFSPHEKEYLIHLLLKFFHLGGNKRKELSANARITAEQKFSNNKMVENYENLFNSLISGKKVSIA